MLGQFWVQCLSQYLETGCPKLAIVKFLGVQIFKGGPQYTKISTNNMSKFIKIRHDILMGIIWRWKELIIRLRLTFKKNPHNKNLVSGGLLFQGLGVQKDTQLGALLAKTMHVWVLKAWLGWCATCYGLDAGRERQWTVSEQYIRLFAHRGSVWMS